MRESERRSQAGSQGGQGEGSEAKRPDFLESNTASRASRRPARDHSCCSLRFSRHLCSYAEIVGERL